MPAHGLQGSHQNLWDANSLVSIWRHDSGFPWEDVMGLVGIILQSDMMLKHATQCKLLGPFSGRVACLWHLACRSREGTRAFRYLYGDSQVHQKPRQLQCWLSLSLLACAKPSVFVTNFFLVTFRLTKYDKDNTESSDIPHSFPGLMVAFSVAL